MHKYLNFHGQYGARLCRDQSLHGEIRNPRTPLVHTIAPFLFNAPEIHLRSLEKIWVDGIISYSSWSHFIGKLQGEWQEFILYVCWINCCVVTRWFIWSVHGVVECECSIPCDTQRWNGWSDAFRSSDLQLYLYRYEYRQYSAWSIADSPESR